MKVQVPGVAAAAVLSVALAAPGASAQTKVEGFALERFDPAPAGDAFFGVRAPWAGGHLVPRAEVMFDYAHHPLRFENGGVTTNIVSAQGFLRADLSLALWDRILVSADVPVALVQSGQSPPIAGVDFHPPSKPAMGDVRFDVRGRLVGDYYDPFQLGLSGAVYVPSGSKDAYTGDGAVRGAFHLELGGRAGRSVGFVWGASGGVLLRAAGGSPGLTFGGGAAITFLDERIQVGPEAFGAIQLGGSGLTVPGTTIQTQSTTNLEVLFGAKARIVSGLMIGASAGPGPVTGLGTPEVRAIGMIGWSPQPDRVEEKSTKPVIGDRDDDGIRDDVDACPDVKGELQSDPAKDGCPPADRDGDGVLDIEDACPGDAGPRNADATKNGCPKDTDEDGVVDVKDACPDVKGDPSVDPKQNGCPADRDGDGITDASDACPDAKGPTSSDPKQNGCPDDPDGDGIKGAADACPTDKGPADKDPSKNGCPKLARLTGDEILLSQQIHFHSYGKTKSEVVDKVSDDLMKEIRDVITAHPEISKIEVQGHTDDMGTEDFNQTLSQERADAVRQWLIDAGIPGDKLVAKGYGFSKPLGDNRVRTGRVQNRRVQFVVIERRK